MSPKSITTIVLILIAGGGLIAWQKTRESAPAEQATTPSDVRPVPSESGTTMTLGFGETGTRGGVSIAPQEPVNDSRCPKDAQCVWAGTVRVDARVKSGSQENIMTFTLGTPLSVGATEVTLVDVTPYPMAGIGIGRAMYRFTFEVKQ